MLAVAKTPLIDLRIKGKIPKSILRVLKTNLGRKLRIMKEDEELINIFETEWFKKMQKNMTPGKSMKIYRENKGWSQDELGKKLNGFSRQYISDLENDRRSISKEIAKKLSSLFHVSVERFI